MTGSAVFDWFDALGIVVAAVLAGAALGLCVAKKMLETATGNARGGEILFLGFANVLDADTGLWGKSAFSNAGG